MTRGYGLVWRLSTRPRGWILVLFVLMAIGLAGVLAWHRALDARLQGLSEQVHAAAARTADASRQHMRPAPALSKAAIRGMRGQAGLLNRNWSTLSMVLVPGNDDVRLLGLDVDPVTGAIDIIGLARNAAGANEYAHALSTKKTMFGDVRLLQLSKQADGTRFEVSARWID